MNKIEIKNLSANLGIAVDFVDWKTDTELTRIDFKLENVGPDTIVFYFLGIGDTAEKALCERLKKSRAGVVVLNRHPSVPIPSHNFLYLNADHFLQFQKVLLDKWHPIAAEKKIVAVTGTNGKTTIVHLCLQISEQLGKRAFSVGTLGVRSLHRAPIETGMTTPAFIQLRKILSDYFKDHDVCFLEASSHALEQGRIYGLSFDVAAWTNFTQDHLDYHRTMDAYFDSKMLLPLRHLKPLAPLFIPPANDELFKKIKKGWPSPLLLKARSLTERSLTPISLFFLVSFNRANLEIALALNEFLWGNVRSINPEILSPPEGRFQVKQFGKKLTVVDYAHTPDALENICAGIKRSFPEKKLVLVFGCGGDRDKTKRPLMGSIAVRLADRIFVTSDNPRNEEPKRIIDDILHGIIPSISHQKITVIEDRGTAIGAALSSLTNDEILIVAGKGHEAYQDIRGTKYPFNDLEIIERIIGEMK